MSSRNSMVTGAARSAVRGLLGLCSLGATISAYAADQADPVAIAGDDGTLLAYAHVFTPTDTGRPESTSAEPLVYVPGFSVDIAEVIGNPLGTAAGTRESGLQLTRQLTFDESPAPGITYTPPLELLVDAYGHTLITLEYANADTGVEHNALALEQLLTDPALPVRARYQSDGTRSIVLGFSMGGLVARYALTRMEHEATDHYTGSYISYDTPHQGASLPLSLEAFTSLMPGVLADSTVAARLEDFNNVLLATSEKFNSLSARQLLRPHLGVQAGGGGDVSQAIRTRYAQLGSHPASHAASSRYYSLRNHLFLLGQYPQSVSKTAFSNGNLRGNTLPLPQPRQGNELIRLTANSRIAGGFDTRILDIRLFDDPPTISRSNCSIRLVFQSTDCPTLLMPESMANLSTRNGSFTDVISRLATVFNNQESPGFDTEFSAAVPPGEGRTTFVSMQSAFDFPGANGQALDVTGLSIEELVERSPFDYLYANASRNMRHDAMSVEMFQALREQLEDDTKRALIRTALPASTL